MGRSMQLLPCVHGHGSGQPGHNSEAAPLSTSNSKQVTYSLNCSPSPETKNLAENAWDTSQESSKLERIVTNVAIMSLQKKKRDTQGHSQTVFAGCSFAKPMQYTVLQVSWQADGRVFAWRIIHFSHKCPACLQILN